MQRNHILASLPAREIALIDGDLETVSLTIDTVLVGPNEPVDYIYFPYSALASVVANPGDQSVGAASIGCEGFIGLPAVLGATTATTTVVQVAGELGRMRADRLPGLLEQTPSLATLLKRYALALFEQTAHSVACNSAHSHEQRCAKWLLVIGDRVSREDFDIPPKYLATILGARLSDVTIVASTLEKAGTIRYKGGRMKIIDRPRLQELACGCYAVLRTLSNRVFEAQEQRAS